MARLLATLLKLVITVGLIFVSLGLNYTETLLRLVLAGRVTEGARVLSWYCVYVLLLAVNGTCEAFVSSVAQKSQVGVIGASLSLSFAAFWVLVGPLMSRFGTCGLVMANTAGMGCRVLCSVAFIRGYFRGGGGGRGDTHPTQAHEGQRDCLPPGEALPHPVVLAAMGASFMVTRAFSPGEGKGEWDVIGVATHVGVGVLCLGLISGVFYVMEGAFLCEVAKLWAARKAGTDEG
ncbi:unnamed protein product, partial [Discosporangium mesarthrocarpum]